MVKPNCRLSGHAQVRSAKGPQVLTSCLSDPLSGRPRPSLGLPVEAAAAPGCAGSARLLVEAGPIQIEMG